MNYPEKVLFIAYQFPPMGGPGVQRSTQFVRFLREFDYEPIVLTIHEKDIQDAGYQQDESLLQFIPANTEIHRVN